MSVGTKILVNVSGKYTFLDTRDSAILCNNDHFLNVVIIFIDVE
jgi:hypothetical protein